MVPVCAAALQAVTIPLDETIDLDEVVDTCRNATWHPWYSGTNS